MMCSNIWQNVECLRSISAFLFWTTILSTVLLVGGLQATKYVIDQRIRKLELQINLPINQPIRTGIAVIEVVVKGQAPRAGRYMDQGVNMQVGVDEESAPLMILSSTECSEIPIDKNKVLYRSTLSLDLKDVSIGKPISHLKKSNLVQLSVGPLKDNSDIISGSIDCTINSSINFKLTIPPQKMDSFKILTKAIDFIN